MKRTDQSFDSKTDYEHLKRPRVTDSDQTSNKLIDELKYDAENKTKLQYLNACTIGTQIGDMPIPDVFRIDLPQISRPSGCISASESAKAIIVQFAIPKRQYKRFKFKDYPSEQDAWKAAKAWRLAESCRLNRTQYVTDPCQLPLPIKKWVAGFFDGDGHVGPGSRGGIVASFSQSAINPRPPSVLLVLQHYFGGAVCLGRKGNKKKRPEWALKLTSRNMRPLLAIVNEHGTVKAPQAKLVLDFYEKYFTENTRRPVAPKRQTLKLHDALTKAKENENYSKVKIDRTKLCLEYIAGLADAEGCVLMEITGTSIRARSIFNIAQSVCPRLLRAISVMIDESCTVDEIEVSYRGSYAEKVLGALHDLLFVKKNQSQAILDHRKRFPGCTLISAGPLEIDAQTKLILELKKMKRYFPTDDRSDISLAVPSIKPVKQNKHTQK